MTDRTGEVFGDTRTMRPRDRARWLLVVIALVVGLVIGRWGSGAFPASAADPTLDATATRSAELDELHALQTQVAQTAVCAASPAAATPIATPIIEPTATQVPPVAAGVTVPYEGGGTWQITVLSLQRVQAPENLKVNGQLIKVTMTLENVSNRPALPPFDELRLTDSAGNQYPISNAATSTVGTRGLGVAVGAHESQKVAIVFDVAVGAGSTFILESTKDPTFRVELEFEARG